MKLAPEIEEAFQASAAATSVVGWRSAQKPASPFQPFSSAVKQFKTVSCTAGDGIVKQNSQVAVNASFQFQIQFTAIQFQEPGACEHEGPSQGKQGPFVAVSRPVKNEDVRRFFGCEYSMSEHRLIR